jgi:phage portal protein BeeE
MAKSQKQPTGGKEVTVVKSSKRLQKTEQVRDRTRTAGFGAAKPTYVPLKNMSTSQIRDFLLTTVWAETCIQTIVDEVVKYDLSTDPTDEKIDSFLKFPSEREPMLTVRKKYLKDMLRWGNGACVIQYKQDKPVGLVTPPGYTLRVTDENPPTYKFTKVDSSDEMLTDKSGKEIEMTGKELIHFQLDADSDSTQARSNLERAYNDVLSDKNMAENLANFTEKGYFLPAFLSLPKTNAADVKEFIEYLNAMIADNAKLFGINKEATVQTIPFWSATDIIEMQRWVGMKVASVYKVPPFMINLVQDVGSLNAREQRARFLENVVLPILTYEAYMLTAVLVRKGFKNLNVQISSPVLGTKLNYDRARIARLLVGNEGEIITADEARKIFFNLPPLGEVKNKKGK